METCGLNFDNYVVSLDREFQGKIAFNKATKRIFRKIGKVAPFIDQD